MQSTETRQDETEAARIAGMIRAIRKTAGALNLAVLDSILNATEENPTAAAASELGTLARRIATATGAIDRQLGANGRG